MDVIAEDVFDYYKKVPDTSIGAVTAFHLIEHLPFSILIKFLDETIRVLKPDGLVILETPNPDNILVSTRNFYFDPTHLNPLPAPMMKFMLESRGFHQVEIRPLHPYPEEAKVSGGELDIVNRFNESFYGPQDYAIIGYKV